MVINKWVLFGDFRYMWLFKPILVTDCSNILISTLNSISFSMWRSANKDSVSHSRSTTAYPLCELTVARIKVADFYIWLFHRIMVLLMVYWAYEWYFHHVREIFYFWQLWNQLMIRLSHFSAVQSVCLSIDSYVNAKIGVKPTYIHQTSDF